MAGNVITSSSFDTASAYVKSDEQSSFPASNINLYTYPFRPWKADTEIASGSHWVGFDLGSSADLTTRALVLDAINCASVKVQTSNASDFSVLTNATPSDTARTISKDFDQRYKLWLALTDYTTNSRYIRVLANDVTTTDGSVYFTVGSFCVMQSLTTWSTNLYGRYTEIFRQVVRPNALAAGGRQPTAIGQPYCELVFSASVMPTSLRSDLSTLIGLNQATPFAIYMNQDNSEQVYLARIVGSVQLVYRPGAMQFSEMRIEEVVAG